MGAEMITGHEGVVARPGFDGSIEEPTPIAAVSGLLRFRRPNPYDDLVWSKDDLYDFCTDPRGEYV